MLDMKRTASTNNVTITGVLNELDIEEKVTEDGRAYVQGKASIKVDQEVSGKMAENIIPVRMFSMRKTSKGVDNPIYDGIVKMKNDFISVAAAETPSQATRVSISSNKDDMENIQENSYIDKTGTLRTGFQISSNFIRKAGPEDNDCATFRLSGVVGKIVEETDKDGEETGRLLVTLVVVGYNGRIHVIPLVAENPVAVNFIKSHWEKEETVSLTGCINMTYKIVTWEEEQGFGEPIKRSRTESRRELVITGGSPKGLDEEYSYDPAEIKIALEERSKNLEKLKEKKKTPSPKTSNDFGF